MKFEEAISKLEKIVDQMEKGDLTLDQALKKYEEGIKLSLICTKVLEDARKKIEIVAKGKDGAVKLEPFETAGENKNSGELF